MHQNTDPCAALFVTISAFVPSGKSTEYPLVQRTNKRQEEMKREETVVCVFIDIERPFDNTLHHEVIEALTGKWIESLACKKKTQQLFTGIAEIIIGQDTFPSKRQEAINKEERRLHLRGNGSSAVLQLLWDLANLGIAFQGDVTYNNTDT